MSMRPARRYSFAPVFVCPEFARHDITAYYAAMTDIRDWQDRVGKAWAESWQLTDRSFAGLTAQFLETLAELPGLAVLDIGCGAGELSLAMARQRSNARIIGLDISPDLIAAAQARAGDYPGVEFELGDAATWQRPGFAPELLISRHGVMFFDDPVAAFTHLRAIAAPTACIAFTCFRSPQENKWASELAAFLPKGGAKPDPIAPGPFAFADPQRVSAILTAAGWSGIRIEPLDLAYIAGTGEDPVKDARAFFSRIGPAASYLRELIGVERDLVEARMTQWLERNRRDSLIAFAAAAWQVTARKD